MEVAIHWQDADSSSAKAVRKIFPKAEIMLCGGHGHIKNIVEKRQKDNHQPILKSVRMFSQSYVRRSTSIANVWGVDVGVLATQKHTPISQWKHSHRMSL